jgi:hypothetical protein
MCKWCFLFVVHKIARANYPLGDNAHFYFIFFSKPHQSTPLYDITHVKFTNSPSSITCGNHALRYTCWLSYSSYFNTSIFKWCMVKRGSKNGHQKDTCLKRDPTTCSKSANPALNAKANVIGRPYMTIQRARESSLWEWRRGIVQAPKTTRKAATASIRSCS